MSVFACYPLARRGVGSTHPPAMMVGSPRTFRPARVAAVLRGAAITSLLAFTACASLAPHIRHPAAPPSPPSGVIPAPAPEPGAEVLPQRTLRVKASAFNSLHGQTDRTPNVGAWGDRLS